MTQSTPANTEHRSSRRRFLLQALGLSAAGLVTGGGAAWAMDHLEVGGVSQTNASQLEAAQSAQTALDLSNAALQKQLTDLQAQLASATGQNAQLASALSTTQQEATDLKTQLATAQTQLKDTGLQLTKHQELAGLYDQLEGIDLDTVVTTGLAAMTTGLGAVSGLAPLLHDGLALARNLLVGFEQALPDFQEAMTWLGDQILNLRLNLYSIEVAAQQTINQAINGLTEVFGEFANFVLDHLPFNIGAKVRETLATIQHLLNGLTDMADGADEKVLGRISQRVGDGPQSWKRTLVKPLRDKTLSPIEKMLTAITEVETTFTTNLNDPAQAALKERTALKEKITTFRKTNGL
jgi:hypothetical protein